MYKLIMFKVFFLILRIEIKVLNIGKKGMLGMLFKGRLCINVESIEFNLDR